MATKTCRFALLAAMLLAVVPAAAQSGFDFGFVPGRGYPEETMDLALAALRSAASEAGIDVGTVVERWNAEGRQRSVFAVLHGMASPSEWPASGVQSEARGLWDIDSLRAQGTATDSATARTRALRAQIQAALQAEGYYDPNSEYNRRKSAEKLKPVEHYDAASRFDPRSLGRFAAISASMVLAGILRAAWTKRRAPERVPPAVAASATVPARSPGRLRTRHITPRRVYWALAIAAGISLFWATRYQSLGCTPPGACLLRNRWTGETVIAAPGRRVP